VHLVGHSVDHRRIKIVTSFDFLQLSSSCPPTRRTSIMASCCTHATELLVLAAPSSSFRTAIGGCNGGALRPSVGMSVGGGANGLVRGCDSVSCGDCTVSSIGRVVSMRSKTVSGYCAGAGSGGLNGPMVAVVRTRACNAFKSAADGGVRSGPPEPWAGPMSPSRLDTDSNELVALTDKAAVVWWDNGDNMVVVVVAKAL
jgi:hypothetical protein